MVHNNIVLEVHPNTERNVKNYIKMLSLGNKGNQLPQSINCYEFIGLAKVIDIHFSQFNNIFFYLLLLFRWWWWIIFYYMFFLFFLLVYFVVFLFHRPASQSSINSCWSIDNLDGRMIGFSYVCETAGTVPRSPSYYL